MEVMYDSDYLKLPHIPFIVKLPRLSFKVHIPMCTAKQKAYLGHFELIPRVGYIAAGFRAYMSMFSVLSEDGYELCFKPENWIIERESGVDNSSLSLNLIPAQEYEAWSIYTSFLDYTNEKYIEQVVIDLDTHKCKPEYVREIIPDIGKYYLHRSKLEEAVGRQFFADKPIKNRRKKDVLTDVDLIASYFFLLELQNQKEMNIAKARSDAVRIVLPELSEDKAHSRSEALRKEIERKYKVWDKPIF